MKACSALNLSPDQTYKYRAFNNVFNPVPELVLLLPLRRRLADFWHRAIVRGSKQ